MAFTLQTIIKLFFVCVMLNMVVYGESLLFDDVEGTTPVTELFGESGEGSGEGEIEVITVEMSSEKTVGEEQMGSTFVLAFPSKPKALGGYSPYLTATNLGATSVTIDIIFEVASYGVTTVIPEDEQETFELPTTAFLSNSNGITNKTIIVCSSGEISLYGFVSESKEDATMFSADQVMDLDPWDKYIRGAYQALSANNLGTEHYIVAYPKQHDFTSVFAVSALENDTSVDITFSSESTPRSPRKFILQFGESYQVLVTSDTTLSTVLSDKPVSVIAASKSETNSVFLLKQIPPLSSFGTEFVLTPFEGGSYDYCIIVPSPTNVTTCEITVAASDVLNTTNVCSTENLVDGFVCMQNVASNIYQKITAEDPLLVVQFLKGYTTGTELVSLAMLIVPPVESYTNEVEFSVIGHGNVFMNIYIISEKNTSFEINGDTQDMSLFLKAEIADMSVYRLHLSRAGRHVITSTTSGEIFTVIVQGGTYSDSQTEVTTILPTTTAMTTVGLDFQSSGEDVYTEVSVVDSQETTDVVNTRYDSLFAYTAGPARIINGGIEVFCVASAIDLFTTPYAEQSTTKHTVTGERTSPAPITTQPTSEMNSISPTSNIVVSSTELNSLSPTTNNAVTISQLESVSDIENIIEEIIENGATVNSDKITVESATIFGESTISLAENTVKITTTSEVQAIIVVFNDFNQTNLQFEDSPRSETRLVSKVISVDLFDGDNEITQLEQPISMVNSIDKPELPSSVRVNVIPLCSSWDPELEYWTDEGCTVVGVEGTQLECECNHLTVFGVLMQFEEYPETPVDTKVLEILTLIGISLSIVSLVITLSIYMYCRLWSCRITIHTNLCLALLFAHLTYVFGIEVNQDRENSCTAITFLMHYQFMATFCWMLVEGLYLFVKVRPELCDRNIHIAVWNVIGWGIPLFIVAISGAVDFNGYGYPVYEFVGEEITKKYRCWLDVNSGLIWAFAGPACFILTVNFIILIEATIIICTMKTNQGQIDVLKSGARLVLVLSFILGLPWIFGLLNFSQYTVVFSYLFVLGNAFQGVFLLFSVCIFDKEIQNALKSKKTVTKILRRTDGNKIKPSDATSSQQLGIEPEKSSTNRSVIAWAEAWSDNAVTTGHREGSSPNSMPDVI